MKKLFFIFLLTTLSFTLFSGEPVILSEVLNPGSVTTYDRYIYIVDGYKIKIYSTADFKLIKEIGGKGEGPGEFRFPLRKIAVINNKIYIANYFSLHVFSYLGEYLNKKIIQKIALHVIPLKNNFVLCEMIKSPKQDGYETNLYDPGFKKIKELYKIETDKQEFQLIKNTYWFGLEKDKIIIADFLKDLIIMYNDSGDEVRRFTLKNEKIPVPEAYKKQQMETLKLDMKAGWESIRKNIKFICPGYFPVINKFLISHGRIFIKTYKNQKGKSEFIILDLKGNILKKVFLPDAKLFSINKNKYYYLRENSDNQWELYFEVISSVF